MQKIRPRVAIKHLLFAAVLLLVHSGAVSADDLQQLREMQEQLRQRQIELEAENARLEKQLRTLERRIEKQARKTAAKEPAPARTKAASRGIEAGYNRGGGGFYIRDESAELRLLGYVQGLASVFDGSLDRPEGHGDFSIRRARLDFIADFHDQYQLFIEIDGGPGTTPTAQSDFALVVAQLNWKILDDALQLRAGKFITPFSNENLVSSRSLDTIERYMALNSLFLLPALDVQFGTMLHGQTGPGGHLIYYLGAFNGNGRANDNLSDDNGQKEIQAKLQYRWSPGLVTGLGLDFSHEEEQILSLADLSFTRYVSVPIDGGRTGLELDFAWFQGPWSLTAEAVGFRFDAVNESEAGLYGGYLQPALFLNGDANRGMQTLLRLEAVHLDADTGGDGDTLYASTLGLNWFVNPNVRLQVNGILHYFDGPSSLLGFSDSRVIPLLLTELQYKF